MNSTDRGLVIIGGLIILALLLTWLTLASFKARAFERLTGKHVSTWDALFVDLRIVEPMK